MPTEYQYSKITNNTATYVTMLLLLCNLETSNNNCPHKSPKYRTKNNNSKTHRRGWR